MDRMIELEQDEHEVGIYEHPSRYFAKCRCQDLKWFFVLLFHPLKNQFVGNFVQKILDTNDTSCIVLYFLSHIGNIDLTAYCLIFVSLNGIKVHQLFV
jgi:hypothetical protein